MRRAWDFGLPEAADAPIFCGYARRYIDAYVPVFGDPTEFERERYAGLDPDQRSDGQPDSVKTLGEIACDDLKVGGERPEGTEALVTLKGDVDDLGRIFERGLEQPTFAKMAGLSRQLNAFFALWLPWVCRDRYPSTYTVFAGGDDFYLIGPWRSTILLAAEMRQEFVRYVAENPQIHFSAGLSMTKPGLPIRQMGHLAEAELERAKGRRDSGGTVVKDAVTCFGHTVGWDAFQELQGIARQIEDMRSALALSTGYLYELQFFADMAEDLRRAEQDPKHSPRLDSALWPSRFAYRTWRMLEAKRSLDLDARKRWQASLAGLLAKGIRKHGSAFKIALFLHLYHYRH